MGQRNFGIPILLYESFLEGKDSLKGNCLAELLVLSCSVLAGMVLTRVVAARG